MLPTFVIALREGVEASLIVGIVAAFLARKAAATRSRMWIGVGIAVALCVARRDRAARGRTATCRSGSRRGSRRSSAWSRSPWSPT